MDDKWTDFSENNFAIVVLIYSCGFLTPNQPVVYPYRIFEQQQKKIMKTKNLFLAILLLTSTMALATTPDLKVVSVKGSSVFRVIYKGAETGKVRLNIFDAQNKRIHSETISAPNGFIYPLNFTDLATGDYTIEVVDGSGKQRQIVHYVPASVIDLKAIHMTKLVNQDGKYLLAISNAQKENIHVRIYDRDSQLVFSEGKEITGTYAAVYKINNAGIGYTFEISDQAGNTRSFSF
jgi:hypothetical protein